ncbi:MAG: trypsin-like peptidase domain-containing protein [Methylobacteriaceae bacterium]|nr:trypsin-like peptidase domain-containing protein [Methylobacteriaceae bacterium]
MPVPNFVAKTTVDIDRVLRLDGDSVLDRFSWFRERLIALRSRDVAALFAEPVITRKSAQLEIAWYAERTGDPVPLVSLDRDARRVVEDNLRRKLANLTPLLGSAEVAPMLRRALVIESLDFIYVIGQDPVLVNWGVAPAGIPISDQSRLDAYTAQTLGAYANFAAPRGPYEAVGEQLSPAARRGGAWRWTDKETRALLIATGIAAAVCLILNLPGVLNQPPAAAASPTQADLDAQKAITQAMLDKIQQARDALKGVNCNPDGSMGSGPSGREKDARLPAEPMAKVADVATQSVVFILSLADRKTAEDLARKEKEKERNKEGRSAENVDPNKPGGDAAPNEPKPDADAGPNGPKPNADAAPNGPKPNADAGPNGPKPNSDANPGNERGPSDKSDLVLIGYGSGFFIGPKTVITNRHVVEDATKVLVTNRFLGKIRLAKIKTMTPNTNIGSPDFAVLEVDTDKDPPNVPLSTVAQRLMNVVSIGFPSNVIEDDPQFKRLIQGADLSAVPEVVPNPGFITVIQGPNDPVPRIIHSAAIAPGNSGGPLVDLCGRAVGINTFISTPKIGYIVNEALATKAVETFLDAMKDKVAYQRDDGPCVAGGTEPPAPPPSAANTPPAPPSPAPQTK